MDYNECICCLPTPKALIETSNNQLLEGDVVYIDIETNIAVLHFRNSAEVILDEQYADSKYKVFNGVPSLFISFDKVNTPVTINETAIANLTQIVTKKPLSFDERIKARRHLESFPKIMANEENKIDTYDKSTFLFDQDRIHLAANAFFNQYNAFVNEQPSTIQEMIANDQLQSIFNEWEEFGQSYAFGEIDITSIHYSNFQYIIQFKSTLGNEKEEVSGKLYFTQMNGKLFVTTFVLN